MKLFFHKLINWEYWPFQVVYIPIYFLWAFYAFKAKSLFFFNASNPNFKNGGFIMVSKKSIYDLIPQKYYPKTILVKENTSNNDVKSVFENQQLEFPIIVKPDVGLRGSGVRKITSFLELYAYSEKAKFDYLLQAVIPYQNEVGIFYVRLPNEKEGRVTGIVSKEFLNVIGNGIDSIENLIQKNPRSQLQLDSLKKELGDKLQEVLPKGEVRKLVPFGNHARGAKFIDGCYMISPKLNKTMNEICNQIPEFYYGRFDIMYNSFEELERGENFLIVELNGAASEPTHIYDPNHSIWFAWKELARHITYMYQISEANYNKGIPYLKHKEGMNEYRKHLLQSNKIMNF